MDGVKQKKYKNGVQSLSVSDVDQVSKWRQDIKKYKAMLLKKTFTNKQIKTIKDNIIILDTYIFLSGARYSCSKK